MLTLDEEDYELLGYARELPEESSEWLLASTYRHEQVVRARQYEQTSRGKQTRSLYAKSQKGAEAHRRAALKWARENREKVKAMSAAWRAKNPNYMKEYGRKYRAAKKGLK